MHIILIPGLWLDASCWDAVVPSLERAGHSTHPLTLPGMESQDADRSEVTLRDHVDAVVRAIDAAEGDVVLVGHSAGGGLAHAAVDARPDRVARVVYVGSEPRGNDDGGGGQWPIDGADVPLPDWSFFEAADVADLDDEQRATMRARAIPSPARATRDPQRLSDERRYSVPITIVACEFPSTMYAEWIAEGDPGAQELARITDVEYVDLPGGHWPQLTQPEALARVILASVGRHDHARGDRARTSLEAQ
jgi:pimeloyl-ACP methyl ester carboxylesterase